MAHRGPPSYSRSQSPVRLNGRVKSLRRTRGARERRQIRVRPFPKANITAGRWETGRLGSWWRGEGARNGVVPGKAKGWKDYSDGGVALGDPWQPPLPPQPHCWCRLPDKGTHLCVCGGGGGREGGTWQRRSRHLSVSMATGSSSVLWTQLQANGRMEMIKKEAQVGITGNFNYYSNSQKISSRVVAGIWAWESRAPVSPGTWRGGCFIPAFAWESTHLSHHPSKHLPKGGRECLFPQSFLIFF